MSSGQQRFSTQPLVRCWIRVRSETDREYGNVVFLPELLCRGRDFSCGPRAYSLGAFKSEQFARAVTCLHHAIGEESEGVAGSHLYARFQINQVGHDSERQAGLDADFLSVLIRRQVTRVCDLQFSSARKP